MKNLFRISGVILLILSIFLIHSCKKDKPTTVPGAPTVGTASAENAQASVIFTAPVSNGGSAITGYTITSNPGNITGTGTASPITVTGLTNGTAYTFTVTATNAIGTSVASSASNSVTPSTAPGAPTIGTASAGNAQAVVTFTAPVSNGGSAITGYTVISVPGGLTGTGTVSPITVSGLTNGTAYTFTVTATNAIGTGVISSASNSVTPSTVPGAPTIGTAAEGNAQAVVTFTAPVSNGGSAITGFTVTSSPGGLTGTGTASPITVSGLINGTAYTFTVTATNAIGTSVASSGSNSVTPTAPITDYDGNVYHTVTIGTQVWLAENLKTTRYNDGTSIPNITDNTAWVALTTGAYSDYSNIPANSTTYGRLYNWYVVDNNTATKVASNGGKNVCPTGWHVPSDAEWTTLTTYLGGESVAGGKLKETGITHWASPNTGATNETGFTAFPGGYRFNDGAYTLVGSDGLWWSSTDYSTTLAWFRYMSYNNAYVSRDFSSERSGFSVRCVRDF
jgi:trimeric autotransporter adhesin